MVNPLDRFVLFDSVNTCSSTVPSMKPNKDMHYVYIYISRTRRYHDKHGHPG